MKTKKPKVLRGPYKKRNKSFPKASDVIVELIKKYGNEETPKTPEEIKEEKAIEHEIYLMLKKYNRTHNKKPI
jgi:hypothetical protein